MGSSVKKQTTKKVINFFLQQLVRVMVLFIVMLWFITAVYTSLIDVFSGKFEHTLLSYTFISSCTLFILLMVRLLLNEKKHKVKSKKKSPFMWGLMGWVTNPQIKTVKELFTEDECRLIIDDFDDYGSTGREVECFSDDVEKLIDGMINDRILSEGRFTIDDIFGLKYSVGSVSYMDEHYDTSELTYVIALNDDFGGGGTSFPLLGEVYRVKTGDGFVFSGSKIDSYHGGYPVTKGVRRVLILKLGSQSLMKSLFNTSLIILSNVFLLNKRLPTHKKLKEVIINPH
jgi:hypothetical protein